MRRNQALTILGDLESIVSNFFLRNRHRCYFYLVVASALLLSALMFFPSCSGSDGSSSEVGSAVEVGSNASAYGHTLGLSKSMKGESDSQSKQMEGMSEIEIPVRATALLDQLNQRPGMESRSGSDATGDFALYFVAPSAVGNGRVELLYRRIMLRPAAPDNSSIIIVVPDEDVATLLNLSLLGEYLLVRGGAPRNVGDNAESREDSVRSLPWVQRLTGDDSVVVVP